jgi:tRNA splicing ligase
MNPVLALVIEMKRAAHKAGCDKLSIAAWLEALDNEKYNNIFAPLLVNQYGDYVLIKYRDLIETFKIENFWGLYDGLYLECRSIVIDLRNEAVVCLPYKKFFNLGEMADGTVDKILASSFFEVSEKMDGSFAQATYYDGKIVATCSTAIDPRNSWRLEKVYNMLQDENYVQMIKNFPHLTFMFELIYPEKDPHITLYNQEDKGLYLIGARNRVTGQELRYDALEAIFSKYGVKMTKIWRNMTLEDTIESLGSIAADELEGYVINCNIGRVKLKGEDHCKVAKLRNSLKLNSPKMVIESIKNETYDDMLAKTPKAYKNRVQEIFKEVVRQVESIDQEVKEYYMEAAKCGDLKSVMIWITENVPADLQGFVRNMVRGKKNDYYKRVKL